MSIFDKMNSMYPNEMKMVKSMLQKSKKTAPMKLGDIDTKEKAKSEYKHGHLEKTFLLLPEFGGTPDESNIIYIPSEANNMKICCDDIISDFHKQNKADTYECKPNYKGKSVIPGSLYIKAEKDGKTIFKQNIKIW